MLAKTTRNLGCALIIPTGLMPPSIGIAATVGNPLCPGEDVLFNPGDGQDIVVPEGFTVSVFASGLNFSTGIAFRGNSQRFEVYILEPGRFPTSRCNDGVAWQAKGLPGNPFTPDVRVFDRNAKLLRTLGKPIDAATETANAFGSVAAAIDIAFEHGFDGGRLFATDSEPNGGRIVTVDPTTGKVVPLFTGLPAGPTGQLALQGRWIYWGSGVDDEQRRRRLRWRATRYSLPGHHAEPECVQFGRRNFHQWLLSLRPHK